MAEVLDGPLGLGGFKDSAVYTSGYTATLLAYALLLDRMGLIPAGPEVARVPETVRAALEQYDAVAARVGRIVGAASAIDVIGRGTSCASAAEAALMFREGLRVPSAAFETLQYLHGTMEAVAEVSVFLSFWDCRELTLPAAGTVSRARVSLATPAPWSAAPAAPSPQLPTCPTTAPLRRRARHRRSTRAAASRPRLLPRTRPTCRDGTPSGPATDATLRRRPTTSRGEPARRAAAAASPRRGTPTPAPDCR